MDFLELLRNRRSYRKFKEQPVEAEKIEAIKKAALMSPAGKRCNEWEFIVVEDKATLQALSTSKESGAELVSEAPLAIVVAADTTVCDTCVEDASIASIIIQLEAADLGLGSCWVQCKGRKDKDGNSCEDNVRRILGIPEKYMVLNIIAIGYKDQDRKPYEYDKLAYDKFHNEKF